MCVGAWCDLRDGLGGTDGGNAGTVWAEVNYDGGGPAHDVSVWGVDSFGLPFCCNITDGASVVDVSIVGTEQADVMRINDPGFSEFSLYGVGGPDSIFGSENGEYIEGGGGDDVIYGYDGQDVILGQNGADLIYGGPDSDTLFGGAGADHIWGQGSPDYIEGGPDRDIIEGGADFDVMYGNDGWDVICAGDSGPDGPGDYLDGGTFGLPSPVGDLDKLFAPSAARVPPTGNNGELCGHVSLGSSWANATCSYILTAPPAECLL